jgi:hypothetical protein
MFFGGRRWRLSAPATVVNGVPSSAQPISVTHRARLREGRLRNEAHPHVPGQIARSAPKRQIA